MTEKRDTERPPIQDQIDNIERELATHNKELGFCMRYCRAAALALGARAAVETIDEERDAWRKENGLASEEDTKPSIRAIKANEGG